MRNELLSEQVFPLFPTLLLLIKKRAAPDSHWLAISVIYRTDSISSMAVYKELALQTLFWLRMLEQVESLFGVSKIYISMV
jgi:hypothetical protein